MMAHRFVNLNGEPVDIKAALNKQQQAIIEHRLNMPSLPRKATRKNGYAAPPGTGPADKKCKDCTHKVTCSNGAKKSWIKCELRRSTWTGGPGTDILANSPACAKFEAKTKEKTNG